VNQGGVVSDNVDLDILGQPLVYAVNFLLDGFDDIDRIGSGLFDNVNADGLLPIIEGHAVHFFAAVYDIGDITDMDFIPALLSYQYAADKIKIGQKAQVRLSGDNQIYDGTVRYISTAANTASRTFDCKVEVPNKDNRLKPGTYAKVDITGSSEGAVLVIPLQAVAGNEESYYVFTDENGVARRNDVTLGKTYNNWIEVKSGLAEGASVICSNINSLQDGDLVTPISKQGE